MSHPSNIRDFLTKSVIVRNANRDKLVQDCLKYREFYEELHCSVCKDGFCNTFESNVRVSVRNEKCFLCNRFACHSRDMTKNCSNGVYNGLGTGVRYVCKNCVPVCQVCEKQFPDGCCYVCSFCSLL